MKKMHFPKTKIRNFFGSLRVQLMTFLFGISLLILVLVWLFTQQFLQPLYNRHIYNHLSAQVNTLVNMISAYDKPISTRAFAFSSAELDTEFWVSVNTAASEGKLDFRNACVDIADSTYRYVNYGEGLHPCLLHENSSSSPFYSVQGKQDSESMVAFRQVVMEQGSYSQIISSSTASQMVVGKRVENSSYGSYTVIFSASLARVEEAATVMSQMMPWILIVLLALSFFASMWFSRWFTRPITQLSHAARQMAQGNYAVRVNVPNSDELGDLATDFNDMANKVNAASTMQRDLLANVSHDLRTPLTLIKGYAETVRDLTGDEPEKRTDQLNIIVDETDRLSGLVNSVMELSKVSSGVEQPQRMHFDMAQLCDEVAARYDGVCQQNGYALLLEADEACTVYADPAMMERVLHNLLGNALHHIGEDGIFVLRVVPLAEGGAHVEVQDHGTGIAKEDLNNIFDRYYRSRSDAGKSGTGLGLSITKAILQGHGFRFGVSSTLGSGSVFWFDAKNDPKA